MKSPLDAKDPKHPQVITGEEMVCTCLTHIESSGEWVAQTSKNRNTTLPSSREYTAYLATGSP